MSIGSPNVPQTSGGVAAAAPPETRENLLQRWVSGLFGRPAFSVLFVLVAFSFPVARTIRKAMPPSLPVLGTIGAFQLVDQTGHAVGTAELEGRVWVLSAIETSSPSADDLAKQLGKIQHRVRNLGPAFHIITVGLDPVADAPDRLVDFANHHRVSPRIWSFLSAEPEALRRAQGAVGIQRDTVDSPAPPLAGPRLLPVGDQRRVPTAAPPDGVDGPLAVAVVDGKMRVRGRYDLADPTAIDTLLYHVGLLVNRGD